jgi:hypothetical protein
VMNHCFICFTAFHRSECCPQRSLGTLFCKRLDDPHSTSSLLGFRCLANDWVQDGTLIVPVWSRLGRKRLPGRRRGIVGKWLLLIATAIGVLSKMILIGGSHRMRNCLQCFML